MIVHVNVMDLIGLGLVVLILVGIAVGVGISVVRDAWQRRRRNRRCGYCGSPSRPCGGDLKGLGLRQCISCGYQERVA